MARPDRQVLAEKMAKTGMTGMTGTLDPQASAATTVIPAPPVPAACPAMMGTTELLPPCQVNQALLALLAKTVVPVSMAAPDLPGMTVEMERTVSQGIAGASASLVPLATPAKMARTEDLDRLVFPAGMVSTVTMAGTAVMV